MRSCFGCTEHKTGLYQGLDYGSTHVTTEEQQGKFGNRMREETGNLKQVEPSESEASPTRKSRSRPAHATDRKILRDRRRTEERIRQG